MAVEMFYIVEIANKYHKYCSKLEALNKILSTKNQLTFEIHKNAQEKIVSVVLLRRQDKR